MVEPAETATPSSISAEICGASTKMLVPAPNAPTPTAAVTDAAVELLIADTCVLPLVLTCAAAIRAVATVASTARAAEIATPPAPEALMNPKSR